MKEKPYILRGDNYLETPCIVKITYGLKYIIVKCMSQPASLKTIENALNAYIRGGKNNPNGMYYFLYEYVKKHPGLDFHVETIFASTSGYQLLCREQEELDKGRSGKKMLNNQLEAYIPAYNQEKKMYGWIPPVDVMNFRNWRKKHKAPRAKRSKVAAAPRPHA